MGVNLTHRNKFLLALVGSSFVGFILLLLNSILTHDFGYSYLITNLFLAWIPLIFSFLILIVLKNNSWLSWKAVILSFLWLVFLPNAFYMITDFIHIQDVQSNYAVYFSVSFASIIFNAVLLGFVSLYLIHDELKKRLSQVYTNTIIVGILLICSFGVYLGRDLRWNSWDVITNPAGILLDFVQRITTPSDYASILGISGALFVLLTSIYVLSRFTLSYIKEREI